MFSRRGMYNDCIFTAEPRENTLFFAFPKVIVTSVFQQWRLQSDLADQYMNHCFCFNFSIPKCYNIQINTTSQSSTQRLFYIHKGMYIYVRATCFDLAGHPQDLQENRSKSCLSFSALWDPKCLHVSVTGANMFISLYKLNLLCDGVNLKLQTQQMWQ